MEHPQESFGKYGNHAEVFYRDVRVPGEALLGAQGAGFLIAQQRLYPGRIHHCMRWLGVSRRAFDMLCERALSREVAARRWPTSRRCRTGSPTRRPRCRPRG